MRVVDYNVKIRVKANGSGVEMANVKMSMNPFDQISVEEALRLKEKILKVVAEAEAPGLIIVGKQAIDDDSNQTVQMLSALLGWAQATFASKVEIGEGSAQVPVTIAPR